jgi:signal transduction histidine kinase
VLAVVSSTWLDIGPFTTQLALDDTERFQRAWVYVASLVGPGMLFPVAIAERREAERRATAALAQLRAILEGAVDLIAAVDRNLVLVAANPSWIASFERITGRRIEPGTPLREAYTALPPGDREAAIDRWRQAIGGRAFESVQEIGDPARVREEFEITYSPVRDERGDVVGASQVVRNLWERRRREAEAAQARRLETVGRLAGGVAHDFNNLMTAIMAYTELVVSTLPPDDPRRQDLGQIDQAASRAGELTQQLLAFARQRPIQPSIVDPSELVTRWTVSLVCA